LINYDDIATELEVMLESLRKYPSVYVYSAGNRAKAILQMIKMGFLTGIAVKGFIVTHREGNRESLENEMCLEDKPVQLVEEFTGNKQFVLDAAVWVVAMEHYHSEIRECLRDTFLKNIYFLSDAMERVLVDDCAAWYFGQQNLPYHYAGHVSENQYPDGLHGLDVKLFRVQSEADVSLSEMLPKQEYVVPIQAGAATARMRVCELTDASGNSISSQNQYYNELTCLYWIWKNTEYRYTGICHYRRLFESDNCLKNILNKTVDVVLPSPAIVYPNLKGYYLGWGLEIYYQVMLDVIKECYADYYRTALWCANHNLFIPNNICIAERKVLDSYCSFLFGVLFEVEKRIKDMDTPKQKRCWLSEHVSTIYFMKRIREEKNFRYCFSDIVRYW